MKKLWRIWVPKFLRHLRDVLKTGWKLFKSQTLLSSEKLASAGRSNLGQAAEANVCTGAGGDIKSESTFSQS